MSGEGRRFICYRCGDACIAQNSIEKRDSEQAANGFADLPDEELATICTECYEELRLEHPYLVKP